MNQNNKNAVVTGATSGIGLETARALAGEDFNVILLCRNENAGQEVKDELMRSNPEIRVDVVVADLANQTEIREAANTISDLTPKLDVLVNNAGTWISKRELTTEGVEKVFAVNHLAYFLLTHLLYPNLAAADHARIVNVSSDSHFQTGMHFDDLSLEGNYHGLRSYAQSKLANVMFTYEFDKRKPHEHVDIYAVQPGLVKTDIGVKRTTWLHSFAWKLRRSGGVSPAEGAATSIYLATAQEAAGQSGKYWDKCKPKPSSKKSYVEEDWQRLWEVSEGLCNIDNYFSL